MFASIRTTLTTRTIAALTLASVSLTGIVVPFSAASAGDKAFNPGLVSPIKPMVPGLPGNLAPANGGGGGGGGTPEPADEPVADNGQSGKGNGELLAAGIIGLAAGAILSGAMTQPATPAAANQLPGWWIAACAQRYKSYNPLDNTYLGFDGYRHACDPR